jgi:hypothetical protein
VRKKGLGCEQNDVAEAGIHYVMGVAKAWRDVDSVGRIWGLADLTPVGKGSGDLSFRGGYPITGIS